MFKNILESVNGFDVWSIATMILFFVFFIALILYVFVLDKKFIDKMSHLPLEEENNNQKN